MLAHFNIIANEASSGTHAVQQLLVSNDYDLIFMDYHMPESNGLEVIASIQEAPGLMNPETKIILWHSSSEDEEMIQKTKSLNVSKRMVKPIKLKSLFNTLRSLSDVDFETDKVERQKQLVFHGIYSILLVEDNPVNMLLTHTIVHRILPESHLFKVVNGLEAVEFCKTQLPDLIFMDIQMPEMNGYEATQGIRAIEGGANIPIIALTAGNVKGEKEKCFASGMNDFISKPVVEHTIALAIEKWLDPIPMVYENSPVEMEQIFLQVEENQLNMEDLKKDFGDDPVFLKEFLLVLKESLIDSGQNLKIQLEAKNIEAFHDAAHKIKGTGFSIKYEPLAEITSELEKITDFERHEVRLLLNKFEKTFNSLLAQVDDELQKYN